MMFNVSNTCLGGRVCKEEYPLHEKSSEGPDPQHVHQIQKKFSELKISGPLQTGTWHMPKNPAERSKNECMYCDSILLEYQSNGHVLCNHCFSFQVEPTPAYLQLPVTPTTDIIILGSDNLHENQILPENICRYCLNTESVPLSDGDACSLCGRLKEVANSIFSHQMQSSEAKKDSNVCGEH